MGAFLALMIALDDSTMTGMKLSELDMHFVSTQVCAGTVRPSGDEHIGLHACN